MKIALILNTRRDSSEFQVEYDPPHTVELIKQGIKETGHEYVFVEADENLLTNLQRLKPDLVFNRAEGIRGESRESHVPAILEMLNIPYVGSNVLTTAICLNKAWTKKILLYHNLPTPKFSVIKNISEVDSTVDFNFPVILKPNEEGSSVGINEDNVVHTREQLKEKLTHMIREYEQPILVEEFIQGREFSVGILGQPNSQLEVLSIIEIDFSRLPPEVGGVFGQRAKTTYDDLDHYICPAKIPLELKQRLETLTLQICEVLEIKDFCRLDFRMTNQGKIYFLEANPLPGMDFDLENKDFSFYPYMAMNTGYSYNQLIFRILESACSRYLLNL
ncbi:MAG: ATP-grasp domain-containing protein [Promethearchaeota archaeon]